MPSSCDFNKIGRNFFSVDNFSTEKNFSGNKSLRNKIKLRISNHFNETTKKTYDLNQKIQKMSYQEIKDILINKNLIKTNSNAPKSLLDSIYLNYLTSGMYISNK